MKIEPGTFWKYTGPGEGRGVRHKVLMSEPHEVITWSEEFNCQGGCGQSFLGDQQEFLACFSPTNIVPFPKQT